LRARRDGAQRRSTRRARRDGAQSLLMERNSVDIEKIAYAAIPVVIGVVIAGFLLANVSLLAPAQSGFTGS
jgi:hypothetical protein